MKASWSSCQWELKCASRWKLVSVCKAASSQRMQNLQAVGRNRLPEAPGSGDPLLEISITPIALKQLKCAYCVWWEVILNRWRRSTTVPENATLSDDHFQIIIPSSCLKGFRFESHIIRLYFSSQYFSFVLHPPIFSSFSSILKFSTLPLLSHPLVLLLP